MYIQACILNVSFPNNLYELTKMIEKNEDRSNNEEGLLDIEIILNHERQKDILWTIPRWAKTDDIIFYFHAKYAFVKIRSIIKEAKAVEKYDGKIKKILDKADKFYNIYGGKVFSIARVGALPEYFGEDDEEYYHFDSRVFGGIKDVHLLKTPISLEQFSQFIRISRQSSITPVLGDSFDKLRKIVENFNVIPEYLKNSHITELPIKNTNMTNWIQSGIQNGRRYILETQYREYYGTTD